MGVRERFADVHAQHVAASGQSLDELADLDPRPGEERDLFPDVQPGFGGPQVPHQVDEARQLVGLEPQQPLVVADSSSPSMKIDPPET